jgi:hypothetical protein
MSRKSRRAAVDSVSSGLSEAAEVLQSAGETVSDTVVATGRKARKQARKLAHRAADSLPASIKPAKAAKPKRRKSKVAVIVLVLAGAGVAAKKFLGARSSGSADDSGPRTPDE